MRTLLAGAALLAIAGPAMAQTSVATSTAPKSQLDEAQREGYRAAFTAIREHRWDEKSARLIWPALATYGALGSGGLGIGLFGIDRGPEAVGREYKLPD